MRSHLRVRKNGERQTCIPETGEGGRVGWIGSQGSHHKRKEEGSGSLRPEEAQNIHDVHEKRKIVAFQSINESLIMGMGGRQRFFACRLDTSGSPAGKGGQCNMGPSSTSLLFAGGIPSYNRPCSHHSGGCAMHSFQFTCLPACMQTYLTYVHAALRGCVVVGHGQNLRVTAWLVLSSPLPPTRAVRRPPQASAGILRPRRARRHFRKIAHMH